MGHNVSSQSEERSDAETVCTTHSLCDASEVVVFQNTHTIGGSDLFYTHVMVGNGVTLAMPFWTVGLWLVSSAREQKLSLEKLE